MNLVRAVHLARRAGRLPRADRDVAVRAWVLLRVVAPLLRRRGLAASEAWLRRAGPTRLASPVKLPPARVAEIVGAVGTWVPHATCLSRTLTLARLVAAPGARVCIGVMPGERALDAHAWLEIDGAVVGDSADVRQRFKVIEARTL